MSVPNRIHRGKTLANYGSQIAERIASDHSAAGKPWEIVEQIASADPSRNKRYTFWMLRAWLRGGIRYLEDLPRTSSALAVYDKFKRHLPEDQRDINRLKRLSDLEDLTESFIARRTGKEIRKDEEVRARAESKILYDGPLGKVISPKTEFASCFWGRGTRWCTAATSSDNMFRNYSRRGPLYILIHPDGDRWQLQVESREYMDARDEDLPQEEMRSNPLFQKFAEVVKNDFLDEPRRALAYAEMTRERCPRLEDCIAEDAEISLKYARWVVKGAFPKGEEVISNSPSLSYDYALMALRAPFPLGEAAIARDAKVAIHYAERILKGPFPLAEGRIARSADASCHYASKVLKGPFPLGEKAISKDRLLSYIYAARVLQAPFPMGEKAIAADGELSNLYAQEVLGGRFLAGEEAIAKNAASAVDYASKVINGRFPEAEEVIARQLSSSIFYATHVLGDRFPQAEARILASGDYRAMVDYALAAIKGRWPEAEEVLRHNASWAANYAENVIKAPWPEAEEEIASDLDAALAYAKNVIRGRWPLGEEFILANPVYAASYREFLGEQEHAANEGSQIDARNSLMSMQT